MALARQRSSSGNTATVDDVNDNIDNDGTTMATTMME
jgi:hypothetical protein